MDLFAAGCGLVAAIITFLIVERWKGTRTASAVAVGSFVLVAAITALIRHEPADAGRETVRDAETLESRPENTESRPREERHGPTTEQLAMSTPAEVPADGYVSSASCRECHADQYDTWHASYHRTMTQRATPETVFGDFDNAKVEAKGIRYTLQRRGDQFWAEIELPPDALRQAPPGTPSRREHPVVLATGSHHLQVYWFPVGVSRTLAQLPICYVKEAARWVPTESSFLVPPTTKPPSLETARWNKECINCHTTHGRSRPSQPPQGSPVVPMDSQVAEFGISCEACHGPAEQHVAFRRASPGPSDVAEDPIKNPRKLTNELSSQVCGRCHSITLPKRQSDFAAMYDDGYEFRPGEELTGSLHLLQRGEATRERFKEMPKMTDDATIDMAMRFLFWDDGMVRVAGREFNGLHDTACYQQGEMSCLSCHSLHKPKEDERPLKEWADDLLHAEAYGDTSCLTCHESGQYQTSSHTHHTPASSGSRCYNCHMPHTTYGLLKAIRSHTIDSPSVTSSVETGRPNACNLCHLDETLAWTAGRLSEWYDIESPALPEDDQQISAAVQWTLKGDAGQRALLAWHLGWESAIEVSGDDWIAPYLATLLEDPYDAVRFIAARSLRKQPAFRELKYDYVGSPESRKEAATRATDIWRSLQRASGDSAVLLDRNGQLDQGAFDRLKSERNDRPVSLVE